MMDETFFYRGELPAAREHLEQTLALYDPQKHRAHAYVYGQDPGVATLSHGSLILWYLGYLDQALSMSERAIKLGESCSHPFSLGFALGVAAVLHQLRRETKAVEHLAAAAVALSSEQGLVFWLAYARVLLGWAQAELGQNEAGIATMRQGLIDLRALSVNMVRPYMIARLAETLGTIGETAEGLTLLDEALALAQRGGMHQNDAELHWLRGELLSKQGASSAEVEKHYRQAIDVARLQEAKSLELRAAISLYRSRQSADAKAEVRPMLAGVFGWFTEGAETADLQEARLLLDELP